MFKTLKRIFGTASGVVETKATLKLNSQVNALEKVTMEGIRLMETFKKMEQHVVTIDSNICKLHKKLGRPIATSNGARRRSV